MMMTKRLKRQTIWLPDRLDYTISCCCQCCCCYCCCCCGSRCHCLCSMFNFVYIFIVHCIHFLYTIIICFSYCHSFYTQHHHLIVCTDGQSYRRGRSRNCNCVCFEFGVVIQFIVFLFALSKCNLICSWLLFVSTVFIVQAKVFINFFLFFLSFLYLNNSI